MPHTYALYPWSWNAAESCHEPPEGAFAVLDLRPEAEQARAGQSSGWGFFAWPDMVPGNGPNIAPPADAVTLGYGDCRELLPDTATRDELRIKLGLSANPGGTTLIDCIGDVLGSLSDPTGQSGPKPLLPTREGLLEIHLSNHSRVWMQAFDANPMMSTVATGRANRIRDVIRTDLETAAKSGGPTLVAKVLGGLLDRWGVDYSQAAKWKNLIRGPLLAELLGKSGGKFNPKKPQTSYSDDFNDGNTTGWTSVAGTWDNAGTAFRYNSSTSNGSARFDSDVSSADHWSIITQASVNTMQNRIGPAVRFAAGATTYYGARYTNTVGGIRKVVTGTPTNLGSTFGNSALHTARLDINGSTFSYLISGATQASATDTSITGNTRGGTSCVAGSTLTPSTADDWSVDDGITAAGQPMALRTGGHRQGWARVGRGF